ncbi:MAG: DUF465 domain-containing protein [Alphaproteobacteria bacterium]|nr:DUF465 domain-containing protein [Alphaproteobacteria bacterium]
MTLAHLAVQQELLKLQREHREIEARLAELQGATDYDSLTVQRLKKRKLKLKDRITELHKIILPKIIA